MNADEARGFAAGIDMQALAEAVHNGRFNGPVTTPYCEEIEAGRLYCMRIANSVALHLAALAPHPQPSAGDVARLVEAAREMLADQKRRVVMYGPAAVCASTEAVARMNSALAAFSGEKL